MTSETHIGGDYVGGDKIGGDKVLGDKHEHRYPPPKFPLNNLPPANPHFTGREKELATLAQALQNQQAYVAITQAITGLGGVGKTQVALAYAHAHKSNYDLIWLLRADKAALDGDLRQLGAALNLPLADKDAETARQMTLSWLNGTEKQWLLLYGNVDAIDARELRPYHERALAISEKVLGPDHPDTAASLNNLGDLLWEMGDLAGARPYYERALAIFEKVLGPDHPDTAGSLNNLGGLLRAMGDLAGAREPYERALAIFEKALGPDHPDLAYSLNNLGMLLHALGDVGNARQYLQRALDIFTQKLGPDHPYTKTVRGILQSLS